MTLISEIEDQASTRYVSWDHTLWTELVNGPGRVLSSSLIETGEDQDVSGLTLRAWLKLGAEAIGCGYLVPARAGATTVLTRLWMELLPRTLASVAPDRRAAVLADCWNLGENLETSPGWLRRIFLHELDRLQDPGDLPSFVAGVGARIYDPPPALTAARELQWVDLAREDRRFLPGEVSFVSPRVVTVRDRLRPEGSVGIWLVDPPIVLGPMAALAAPPSPVWPWHELGDRRISRVHHQACNPGFAVATLETSQQLVVVRPETG